MSDGGEVKEKREVEGKEGEESRERERIGGKGGQSNGKIWRKGK